MQVIKYKDGTKSIEYHMSAGKGLALERKLGTKIFSMSSETGLFQICGLDPGSGYRLFMTMLGIEDEAELDKFETDDIWDFLEGCFADFFPPKLRMHIPEFLGRIREMALTEIQKAFSAQTLSPTAPSNSVTGSQESLAVSTAAT